MPDTFVVGIDGSVNAENFTVASPDLAAPDLAAPDLAASILAGTDAGSVFVAPDDTADGNVAGELHTTVPRFRPPADFDESVGETVAVF